MRLIPRPFLEGKLAGVLFSSIQNATNAGQSLPFRGFLSYFNAASLARQSETNHERVSRILLPFLHLELFFSASHSLRVCAKGLRVNSSLAENAPSSRFHNGKWLFPLRHHHDICYLFCRRAVL